MKLAHIFSVFHLSVGMGGGQLLFRFAAKRNSHVWEKGFQGLLALCFDWVFLSALCLYALLTVYWVWLLTFIPLSKAYPLTLFSLLITTLGGYFIFLEPVSLRFILGLCVTCAGLILLSTG